MPLIDTRRRPVLPASAGRRLNHVRLSRPTPLPSLVPTTPWGRYLHRLAWLFGGGRL